MTPRYEEPIEEDEEERISRRAGGLLAFFRQLAREEALIKEESWKSRISNYRTVEEKLETCETDDDEVQLIYDSWIKMNKTRREHYTPLSNFHTILEENHVIKQSLADYAKERGLVEKLMGKRGYRRDGWRFQMELLYRAENIDEAVKISETAYCETILYPPGSGRGGKLTSVPDPTAFGLAGIFLECEGRFEEASRYLKKGTCYDSEEGYFLRKSKEK